MTEIDNSYNPVPIQMVNMSNSNILDPEEERIQKLRDRKIQEKLTQEAKMRVQQLIDDNHNRNKNKFISNYINNHTSTNGFARNEPNLSSKVGISALNHGSKSSNSHGITYDSSGQAMQFRKLNADKLPNGVASIKFSTNEVESVSPNTKNSFYTKSGLDFNKSIDNGMNGLHQTNSSQFPHPSKKLMPKMQHQMDIGDYAHPTHAMVPK